MAHLREPTHNQGFVVRFYGELLNGYPYLQLNILKKLLHAVEPAFGLGAVAVFFFF